MICGAPFAIFRGKFLSNSAAQFVKFHDAVIPKYPTFHGQLVSKYKEIIVTCNVKIHYIGPLILLIIIKVTLQRLDVIVL